MKPDEIWEYLSPHEKKILPFLKEKNIDNICKKTQLDKVSVLRALEFLKNKKIVSIETNSKKIVDLGNNGVIYKKIGLPERRLLHLLSEKRILALNEAGKLAKLSDEEFKASIGVLKKKAMIELKNGKIILNAGKEEVAKKMLEEKFLELLPLDYSSLAPEQLHALKSLESRKNIVEIREEKITGFQLTFEGGKIINEIPKDSKEELIEQLTSDILQKEIWKGKKFRRYDITSPVPEINGGKEHFVNQAINYSRKIWTDMGFKEMTGNLIQSSFWNFDALFTAQDHPVREMQDTFFINRKSDLPDKKIINAVKDAHEGKIKGSKGWNYKWNDEEAKKLVLRTHTTCLSAQTLANLNKQEIPSKFFAVGKVFRNETIDWSHGFEFYQTEGIVVDRNANFTNLLGYLKQFYSKMGFEKVRFAPAYFPYTEPSVEIHVFHPERKIWLELGGAGILRPEITIPLLGSQIPVLAWGLGLDRIITDYYNVKDLRELYKNDLRQLRRIKFWIR